MEEKEELSDKLDKIEVPTISKPKRKIAVRVKGQIMLFDSMEQYFSYRKQKKETKRKTDELYKNGQIKPPEFYSFSQT